MQTHLSRTRKLLEEAESAAGGVGTRQFNQLFKSLQNSLDELKRQNKEHLKFRSDFARELVEHVKMMQINAVPMHQVGLQSLPYPTGKAREAAEAAKKKKGKKKKQKTA